MGEEEKKRSSCSWGFLVIVALFSALTAVRNRAEVWQLFFALEDGEGSLFGGEEPHGFPELEAPLKGVFISMWTFLGLLVLFSLMICCVALALQAKGIVLFSALIFLSDLVIIVVITVLSIFIFVPYLHQEQNIEDKLTERIEFGMQNYDPNSSSKLAKVSTATVDYLFKEGKCCGLTDSPFVEWGQVPYGKVPTSCCQDEDQCSDPPTQDQIWSKNCVDKWESDARGQALLEYRLSLALMIFCVIDLAYIMLGLVCLCGFASCMLCCA